MFFILLNFHVISSILDILFPSLNLFFFFSIDILTVLTLATLWYVLTLSKVTRQWSPFSGYSLIFWSMSPPDNFRFIWSSSLLRVVWRWI
jgi:hypothetical protein